MSRDSRPDAHTNAPGGAHRASPTGRVSGFQRVSAVEKPGVGTVHLYTGLLRRNHIREASFQPVGRAVLYKVPLDLVEQLFAVDTFEQAMALLRGVGAEASPVE